jgi:hypothetical protein
MGRWYDRDDVEFLRLYQIYRCVGDSQVLETMCEDWFIELARGAAMVDRTLPARYRRIAQVDAVVRCKRACERLQYNPDAGDPYQFFNRICHNERKRQREAYDAYVLKRDNGLLPYFESLEELSEDGQQFAVDSNVDSDLRVEYGTADLCLALEAVSTKSHAAARVIEAIRRGGDEIYLPNCTLDIKALRRWAQIKMPQLLDVMAQIRGHVESNEARVPESADSNAANAAMEKFHEFRAIAA